MTKFFTRAKFFTIVAVLLTVFFVAAEPASAALPKTFSQFKARYAKEARNPEGAVKLYFDAVFAFINPDTRAEATNMLRYSLRESKDWEKRPGSQTFVSRMKDPAYEHIFRSFAAGATPENNYSMNKNNYKLQVAKVWTGHPSGDLQVTLHNKGADNVRPLYLQKENGLWFITNNASTYAGVRFPTGNKDKPSYDADYDDENYGVEAAPEDKDDGDDGYDLWDDADEPKKPDASKELQDALQNILKEQLLKK